MLFDTTPGIEEHLASDKHIAYIGFDPTAPSLTIGNYVQVMTLKLFQKHGHTPIALIGGATGRIGDPSGKDKERELKSIEEIEFNVARQTELIRKLLKPDPGQPEVKIINNYRFYENMNVLDFLRDVGKTLTVNYMMSKESVKSRLDSGLSFTEFSYQLLQAYDFLCLYRDHNVTLQMGGSDQWGNITSGTEFIRRHISGKAYAATTKLLTRSDGRKFGKSESGNVWMSAELTSPYRFYQFWINADDADVPNYAKYFSLRTKGEILGFEQLVIDDPIRAKRELAEELTERIHGTSSLKAVRSVSQILFNRKASKEDLLEMSGEAFEQIKAEIPSFQVDVKGSVAIDHFLVDLAPVFQSKGELRRSIQNQALSVNKDKVNDHELVIRSENWIQGSYLMVENGKKNKYLIYK